MTGHSDRLAEALAWADEHNAVLRFNGNDDYQGRSLRVTVAGHKPEDRITAVLPVHEDGDLAAVLAETVFEVRDEHRATSQRRHLQVVAHSSSSDGAS